MPSVPEGEKLDFGSKEFREFEDIGESPQHRKSIAYCWHSQTLQ